MTKDLPPYVMATGTLKSVLEKIKKAAVPPRFTQDFLVTKLGFKGSGSTKAIIPFFKKIGLLGSDGIPTSLYEKFRDPDPQKAGFAIAESMKVGYTDLYERDEYFHDLDKNKTKDFLVTATGSDPKNASINSLNNTLEVLKSFANFDRKSATVEDDNQIEKTKQIPKATPAAKSSKSDFNISYTINLNLPETSDPAVFDAIFKSLKEHILSDEE